MSFRALPVCFLTFSSFTSDRSPTVPDIHANSLSDSMSAYCNIQVPSSRVTVTTGSQQIVLLKICLLQQLAAACRYKSCYKSYQSLRYAPVRGELPSTKFILRLFKFLLCIIHFFSHPLEHNINGRIQQC